MAFMSPAKYERVQAISAWAGRFDACLLRHVDEFNQTAGRNMGFRGREGSRHHLLVNPRLFALLWRARSRGAGTTSACTSTRGSVTACGRNDGGAAR